MSSCRATNANLGATIVVGDAMGVDETVRKTCQLHSYNCRVVNADWKRHGRAAGPIRNNEMAKMSDACIAFWDGLSPGTRSAIGRATYHGLNVQVFSLMGKTR